MAYRTWLVPSGDARYAAIVADLHAQLFPKIIFPYPHYGDWWVVWEGKKPVAFAHCSPTTYYPNSGYFGRVGVLPAHRGHGLQARLMKKVVERGRELGWEAMYSDTTRVPHSAANFRKMGWTEFTPESPWGSKHTIYWRKEL
jgi:GNAT superfamily N-acetyltransferase